jgi:hypothetical protein
MAVDGQSLRVWTPQKPMLSAQVAAKMPKGMGTTCHSNGAKRIHVLVS